MLGYLVYSLAVLVFMLWFLFPGTALKSRMEAELHRISPDLQWHIGSIRPALPAALQLNDSTLCESSSGKELLKIDSLVFRPDLRAYLQHRNLSAAYSLIVSEGSIEGLVTVRKGRNELLYTGVVKDINLDKLHGLLQNLNRSFSGTLSGDFTGTGRLHGSGVVGLDGSYRVVQGAISFHEPVLGMDKLTFAEVAGRIHYESGMIQFQDGMLKSRLLGAEFSGTLKPDAGAWCRSELHLQGALIPRPEFLSGPGDKDVVNLFRMKLQNGRLPFIVSGGVCEPGIVFEGLPPGLNKRLQGRGR